MFFHIIKVILLSLYWELPRRKHDFSFPSEQIERELETKKKKEVSKQLERREKPQWKYVDIKRARQHRGYLKSSPRDGRFSNQRSLRRMYRNC